MTSIGDRLARARGRRFVGRSGEIELLRTALIAQEPPFSVLWVHGPGGVGKTTLLTAFAGLAAQFGVSAARVDARADYHSTAAFRAAVEEALDVAGGGSGRQLLLLDTYEQAAHLDDWLRETFLPGLPSTVTVVIAGRKPPFAAWRADPGWHELLRVVSLRNLRPDESREYLAIEGLGEQEQARVLDLTHGHPLAMSLFVDVLVQQAHAAGAPVAAEVLRLRDAPNVVGALMRCFVDDVPSQRHRAALGLAARVRHTDEGVLGAALGGNDAADLLAWLRELSFMEQDAWGVFPHDLAREVLDTDLFWRDRLAFEDLHRRARGHILARVRRSAGLEQQRAAADLAFLHRTNPVMSAFLDWSTLGLAWADRVTPADVQAVLSMLEAHQGSEQAALAERWLDRQPDSFMVVRRPDGEAHGAAALLRLDLADPDDIAADPGAAATWAFAHRHAPPRPGEAVSLARFVVDRERNQETPSLTLNAVSVWHSQHIIHTPSPAWDFVGAFADPDAVAPLFSYIFFDRAPGADFEVGGRRYGVFAHDWRRMDVEAWLDATGRQEISDEAPPLRAPLDESSASALSQPEFAAAVRSALRDLHRPEQLARNPLLPSRAVRDRAGADGSPEVHPGHLRAVVEEAVATLTAHPRDEKLHRVLDRTFLRPAPTQEAAMELLDLPPTTYRRHLNQAVERVVNWLWERDLYGPV